MRAIDIFLLVAFILIALLVIYYIYKQVIWSKINKYYAFAKFNDALNEINKLYKFSTPLIRKKMIVYKTSCSLLLDKRNEFLETLERINKNSIKYGQYYYYYKLAYMLKVEKYKEAELIYSTLTKKFRVDKDLDLVTPLAIMLANNGDKKGFTKLRELKRNNHIDITFIEIANDYIRKHKNDGNFN
jgi:hypothetical protein